MTLPAQSELGVIRGGNGYTYQITPEDVLWLARAVKYEGGNYAATCWAYATRMVAWRYSGSLAQLVLAHSSTVNPLWATAGAGLCVEHPDNCADWQIQRRNEARARSWETLGSAADTVLAFAQARLENPAPRADDFAAGTVASNYLARHPEARVILSAHGASYIADSKSVDAPARFVRIEYQGRTASDKSGMEWLPLGLGIAAGMLGMLWWSR